MSGVISKIKEMLRKHKDLYFILAQSRIRLLWMLKGDKRLTEEHYKEIFGRDLNLDNPVTLNEKMQWLKLYNHQDFHTIVADKYAAREWLSDRFGSEYLVPLLFSTTDYRDVRIENIPSIPCIVKANNGCGSYFIVRDKNMVDWNEIQRECRRWLATNYYYASQEWQYKNIKPRIIIEKLLLTKEGRIPNDYKLHFINGELEFIYCSVDREGGNYRNIYNSDWEPLEFIWIAPSKMRDSIRGPEIRKPASFEKMVEIGSQIAKEFPYVRVDFYDVDGILYYGEVTLHHGGGFDVFIPQEMDTYYGNKLDLSRLMNKVSKQ